MDNVSKTSCNGVKWLEELSQSKEDFIKNYDENSNQAYLLEVDLQYPKNHHNLHTDLPFLPERKKIKKCSKLVCDVHDKKTM